MALSHPQMLLVVVSRSVREREDLALTGGAKGEQADVVVIHGQKRASQARSISCRRVPAA